MKDAIKALNLKYESLLRHFILPWSIFEIAQNKTKKKHVTAYLALAEVLWVFKGSTNTKCDFSFYSFRTFGCPMGINFHPRKSAIILLSCSVAQHNGGWSAALGADHFSAPVRAQLALQQKAALHDHITQSFTTLIPASFLSDRNAEPRMHN